MNRKVFLSGLALLLVGIVSISGRPQDDSKVSGGLSTSTVTVPADGVGSSTVSPQEESKISKFFDDVSSVFKTGTAKVKESFENAATSVKDGVMRGYDYVKDKLTGNGEPATVVEITTTKPEAVVPEDAKSVSVRSTGPLQAAPVTTTSSVSTTTGSTRTGTARAVKVEPNDEDSSDDESDRVVFVDNEDTDTDSPAIPTTTVPGSTTKKFGLDDRFIIDGPMACKSGQTAVNGKCRNTI
ncbi:uncharacterized protein LOC129759483 [Uranotaenia lowii]|uniref:uncharacterized protein LOC129759483 n=1 Tax=Uranotaenia lowii TaxID=190385 RepID=UPI00247AAEC2|nr:uncharacterized protein LOC129759483 [Uranotaenia lowii]